MSLAILVVAVAVASYRVGRGWVVAIVPAAGMAVGLTIVATGGSIADTPLAFVIAVTTLASAASIVVRRRALPVRHGLR